MKRNRNLLNASNDHLEAFSLAVPRAVGGEEHKCKKNRIVETAFSPVEKPPFAH